MSTPPGTRVFAVRSATPDTVELYGFGTYTGDRPRPASDSEIAEYRQLAAGAIANSDANPPDVTGWYDRLVNEGAMTREEADAEIADGEARAAAEAARPLDERVDELLERLLANPYIELDDGTHVWGCECWWSDADRYDEFVGNRTVTTVATPARPQT